MILNLNSKNHYTKRKKIAIIGAGISGLSLAWFLEKRGFEHIHIFEQRSTIGGILQTNISAQSVIEQAAESVGMYPKTIMNVLDEVGLSNEIIYPKTTQFQIYVKGKLVNPPQGLRFMVPTQIEVFKTSLFFTDAGKQRIYDEANVEPLAGNKEESLKDFVCRRFGEEMYLRYAAPVYGGIFGYAANQLSMQSVLPQLPQWEITYGSVTKAVQTIYPASFLNKNITGNNFFSLKNGMRSLTRAIKNHLEKTQFFLNHQIEKITNKNASWQINDTLYNEVFVTCAAPVASGVVSMVNLTLSNLLNQIAFKSAGIITLIFNQTDIELDQHISGILLPVEDFAEVSAITFSSNKWNNRITRDKVLLRLYLRDTPLLKKPAKVIVFKALKCLQQFVKINSQPSKYQYNLWYQSRPLYTIGHQKKINDIELILETLPGLHLTGCSYKGSGVASLVHQAKELAMRV